MLVLGRLPLAAKRRLEVTATSQASPDQLRGLPPTLIITGEHNVLRDKGDAYAQGLRGRRAGHPGLLRRHDPLIRATQADHPDTGAPSGHSASRQLQAAP